MKLHKNLVEAVVEGLYNTFVKHQYADKVVEQLLKRDKRWGARDRGFIAESLYQIVRYKRLYQAAAGLSDLQELSHFYELFAVWAIEQEAELPAWLPFTGKVATVRQRLADFQQERKLRESVPDWLDALGEAELGAQWAEELHALNEAAKVVLRANTLRNSAQSLQAVLDKDGIATQRLDPYPDALV